MTSPSTDEYELSIDDASVNIDSESEENEDQIEDPRDNQSFDPKLIEDVPQQLSTTDLPTQSESFGNEETGSDSGIGDNDSLCSQEPPVEVQPIITSPVSYVGRGRSRNRSQALDVNSKPLSPPQITEAQPIMTSPVSYVGRGRNGRQALDVNSKPLPPPQITEVEYVTPGKPLRKARLPASYNRKREDSEVRRQRFEQLRSILLIDFTATFNQISFIVDKDDSQEKGYQHACRRLQAIIPDLQINQRKPHSDIWNFGLHIYSIPLEKPMSCDLMKLIPEKIDQNENRPFWFMFKNPPDFQGLKFTSQTPKDPQAAYQAFVSLGNGIRADLSSGALISMNRYCVDKEHTHFKRNRWSLCFRDENFEVQTIQYQANYSESRGDLIAIKYRIPLEIIDRGGIIHLWNNGFCLFVNVKGNIHELRRKYRKREINEEKADHPFEPFIRQGIAGGKAHPSFSTICLRIRMRTDEEISEFLSQKSSNSSTNVPPSPEEITKIREDSLQEIRNAFKGFLDFFSKNRLSLCFGPVFQRVVSLDQLATLSNREFPTFLQSYSWTMLKNIGFRVQNLIYLSQTFIGQLHDYSKQLYDEEQADDIDDRFYRLCLYLHRRSLEYFFLDLNAEIENGIAQYKEKYEDCKRRKAVMHRFYNATSSAAYIPSVVITPTTIKIRPLKLCKLNRVLRERRFGGFYNFALIELRDEAQRSLFPSVFRALKGQIAEYLSEGFHLTSSRIYKYLHHSQSQVKCKQFWFYYHDKDRGYLSHADAYTWMGNFDKERVVAKHAARIALCFTSTDPTIQIPAEMVTYVRDVKDPTGTYTFTDGVGRISSTLRDQIQAFLKKRYQFSVIQIRYGGSKGTLSVDPRLDNEEYQMHIRDSMNKFTTDHDILEVCKLSAPRALYLNRQDIVLMESRDIPHTNFLQLQNEQQFALIRALLTPAKAFELLNEKILPVFQLRKIARRLNIIKEPFFLRLITTCAFNIMRELIDRTRIRIDNTKARNMFGIVDEYAVLESGEVFIQYSLMRDNRLDSTIEEERDQQDRCEIHVGNVVITKNPCHHPGDLRVFKAVDRPELRHLKDVVVFPQKGDRPHSNEISGSDLDGDEYVVIWLDDLIPQTSNEDPYDYDSQADPEKLNRPITRDDINEIVMRVSEQDCLGTLSNIHLAYADKKGIKSKVCTDLAGAISQEVDAAKTGQHPLSENEINELRDGLNKQWPDFMKSRGKKDFYRSERVLGKLYRSARRAMTGWSRAINNHGNAHHIQLLSTLTGNTDLKDQSPGQFTLTRDPNIFHKDYQNYLPEIKRLYRTYREEMLEIISLYRFEDEIDLFCRSESMDASAGGGKKGSLEDSAAIEVKNLVERIQRSFHHEFEKRTQADGCFCEYVKKQFGKRSFQKRIDCERCAEDKLIKAACAYIHCYDECIRLPPKSNRRILSFPWLFGGKLLRLREDNNPADLTHRMEIIVGPACVLYLGNFTARFKVLTPSNSLEQNPLVEFYYEKSIDSSELNRQTNDKLPSVPLLRVCFIEILNDWLIKQKIFGEKCMETDSKPLVPESIWHELIIHFLSYEHQTDVRALPPSKYQTEHNNRYNQMIKEYSLQWTNREHEQLLDMFDEIHSLAVQHAKRTSLTIWIYLDEYILLALQCIAIEKQLVEKWISS